LSAYSHPDPSSAARAVVLVTDGGNGQNRSALSAVRALGAAGYEVHVTTTHSPSVAGASRFCARRPRVPSVEHPEFRAAVEALRSRHGYRAVFPASDAALIALDWSGCTLVDKAEVGRRSSRAGFRAVPEHVYDQGDALLARAGQLDYPVVVKPVARRRNDDPTAWRADGPADIARARGAGPLVVQPYLGGPLRAVTGVMWGGRVRAVAHQVSLRTWPRSCGVSCAAVTVRPDRALEARLVALLDGYEGIFQVQLLGDHVIDINPRVYGSMSLAARAGVNLPDVVCRLVGGEAVGEAEPLRAGVGTQYRWLEGDVRHLADAVRGGSLPWGQAVRAAWPGHGVALGDVSLNDPAPTLARVWHLARTLARKR
jgi:hypothetical protein